MKKLCEENGIEWKPTKHFIIDRLPLLVKFYLFADSTLPYGNQPGVLNLIRELFTLDGLKSMTMALVSGFIGFGSIWYLYVYIELIVSLTLK